MGVIETIKLCKNGYHASMVTWNRKVIALGNEV